MSALALQVHPGRREEGQIDTALFDAQLPHRHRDQELVQFIAIAIDAGVAFQVAFGDAQDVIADHVAVAVPIHVLVIQLHFFAQAEAVAGGRGTHRGKIDALVAAGVAGQHRIGAAVAWIAGNHVISHFVILPYWSLETLSKKFCVALLEVAALPMTTMSYRHHPIGSRHSGNRYWFRPAVVLNGVLTSGTVYPPALTASALAARSCSRNM